MFARHLADLVLVFHLLFIVFVVAGGFVVLYRPKLAVLHLPCVLWGLGIESSGQVCPLTYLENHLRSLGEQQGFSGSFIDHYIVPIIYPPGLTPTIQATLGLALLLINLVLYLSVANAAYEELRPPQDDPHSAAVR